MFENMPSVPKGKFKIQPPQRRRLPWLVGLAGCLILLLVAGLAGLSIWYFAMGPGNALISKNGLLPPGAPSPVSVPASAATTPVSVAGARGRIAFSVDSGDGSDNKEVWLMNADGSDAVKILSRASSPALSPDGRRIAYYHWSDGIYVANADGSNARQVVSETNIKSMAWSQDGNWIAFSSQPTAKGNVNIDVVRSDGGDRHTLVIGGSLPSWSPDGHEVVFQTCRDNNCGIYRAAVPGGAAVLVIGEMGGNPSWSPDGKRIAYHADTDTVKQMFIVNADGSGRKQLTGGEAVHVDPQWSSDGNWIYYRSPEGGAWGIWRMNPDGSGAVRVAESGPPTEWAYERLAVSR